MTIKIINPDDDHIFLKDKILKITKKINSYFVEARLKEPPYYTYVFYWKETDLKGE